MARIYFTFGSDPRFPFGRNDYVVAEGTDAKDAIRKFNERHPERTPGIVNCAFFYTEEKFNEFRDEYYKGIEPAEIIR